MNFRKRVKANGGTRIKDGIESKDGIMLTKKNKVKEGGRNTSVSCWGVSRWKTVQWEKQRLLWS